MSSRDILEQQARHWGDTIQRHGANWKGVDYSNAERVQLCFGQLTGIWRDGEPATVLDFGCGYGALLDYLRARGLPLAGYHGHDIAEPMLAQARAAHAGEANVQFGSDPDALAPADYVICAGIFNVKLDALREAWHDYVVATLDRLWPLARRGLAFNILTSYSDPEKMRPDLYYADPCWFFDYAKRHWSRQVALLHDYGAYEFTLHVRR